MRVLLLTPPMTQLNTPYPATAYLTGFLRGRGYDVVQADPAIELVLKIFSREGLTQITEILAKRFPPIPRTRAGLRRELSERPTAAIENFLSNSDRYIATVDAAVRFLQGRDPSLALRIGTRDFLPEGPRFVAVPRDAEGDEILYGAFGSLGVQDRAKYLASLFIDDLADVVREGVDPRFELSRYGEKLAASAATFDALQDALDAPPTWVDLTLDKITQELLNQHKPDVLGLTAPFPGNVYGAFRIARLTKRERPTTRVILGGGYVNTELRELRDPRVFDDIDYITLDDGERPFLTLLDNFAYPQRTPGYLRTS